MVAKIHRVTVFSAMEGKGVTVEDISKASGFSEQTVATQLATGECSHRTINALAKLLNLDHSIICSEPMRIKMQSGTVAINSPFVYNAMKERGLTGVEVSTRLNRSKQWVSLVLNRGQCQMHTAKLIADAIGIHVEEMLEVDHD